MWPRLITRVCLIFHTNENTRQSHISLSKMVAVDDGYRRRCHPRSVRPGAAWRGRAREHPIPPFGNERCKRRPGQSGAGRVSPSRRPRPRKPGSSFGRRAPLVGLGHKSRRTHSLKGIVPEVAAHVSVVLGGPCGGGGVAQPHASTAASTAPVERTLMSSSAGHGAPAVHF